MHNSVLESKICHRAELYMTDDFKTSECMHKQMHSNAPNDVVGDVIW